MHYIGDKLRLVGRVATWLTSCGRFAANLDLDNICISGGGTANRIVAAALRNNGFEYSFRYKLLALNGSREVSLPFEYLGADDQAGPNYTGQPAVNSFYKRARG